jgi:alkaline phosphatase
LAHEIAASRYLHGSDYGLSFNNLPQMAYVTTWDVDTYNYYAADEALGGGIGDYSESDFWPFAGYADYIKGVPSLPYPLSQDNGTSDYYFLRKHKGVNTTATDSASSATALATGKKTDAGNISWKYGDPEVGSIETIAEKVRRELGGSFDTTTTVPFNHATPACFIAHNIYRSNYSSDMKKSSFTGATLAEEIVQTTQPDVVIGAGHPLPAALAGGQGHPGQDHRGQTPGSGVFRGGGRQAAGNIFTL